MSSNEDLNVSGHAYVSPLNDEVIKASPKPKPFSEQLRLVEGAIYNEDQLKALYPTAYFLPVVLTFMHSRKCHHIRFHVNHFEMADMSYVPIWLTEYCIIYCNLNSKEPHAFTFMNNKHECGDKCKFVMPSYVVNYNPRCIIS